MTLKFSTKIFDTNNDKKFPQQMKKYNVQVLLLQKMNKHNKITVFVLCAQKEN